MPCTYTVNRAGPTPTVALAGDVTFADNATFRSIVDEVLAGRPSAIAVDLSGVRMIDSAGLSLFVLLREQAVKAGAGVSLLRPNATVERVLEVVGFGKLFTIVR